MEPGTFGYIVTNMVIGPIVLIVGIFAVSKLVKGLFSELFDQMRENAAEEVIPQNVIQLPVFTEPEHVDDLHDHRPVRSSGRKVA